MTLIFILCGLAALALLVQVFVAMRERRLRTAGVLPPKGKATMADVERLLEGGNRILAIRVYREIHEVGLKEAKTAVDALTTKAT